MITSFNPRKAWNQNFPLGTVLGLRRCSWKRAPMWKSVFVLGGVALAVGSEKGCKTQQNDKPGRSGFHTVSCPPEDFLFYFCTFSRSEFGNGYSTWRDLGNPGGKTRNSEEANTSRELLPATNDMKNHLLYIS